MDIPGQKYQIYGYFSSKISVNKEVTGRICMDNINSAVCIIQLAFYINVICKSSVKEVILL